MSKEDIPNVSEKDYREESTLCDNCGEPIYFNVEEIIVTREMDFFCSEKCLKEYREERDENE